MTCYPLHDEIRNTYADSDSVENVTDAVLTGSEGEVYVYEPHYWYKGVTDVLNQCLYGFISSNEDAPAAAGYTSVRFTREELNVTEGIGIRKNTDYTTLKRRKTNTNPDRSPWWMSGITSRFVFPVLLLLFTGLYL